MKTEKTNGESSILDLAKQVREHLDIQTISIDLSCPSRISLTSKVSIFHVYRFAIEYRSRAPAGGGRRNSFVAQMNYPAAETAGYQSP